MSRYQPYPNYKDSGVEWLGEVPKEWFLGSLRRGMEILTDFEANGSFADVKANVTLDDDKDQYAWYLRATDLENKRHGIVVGNRTCNYKSYQFLSKTILFGKELLIAKRGEIGKIYVVPFFVGYATLAPNLYLIRTNDLLEPKFAYYWFSSSYGKPELLLADKSTTIGALYKDDVKDCKVLFPTLPEQTSIANFLDIQTVKIDTLIAKQQRMIRLLGEKRSAMISHAVTKGLNPDVAMKDSGVKWLGEVPEQWRSVSLKWISKIYSGGTPDKTNLSFWDEGTIPWLSSGEVNQFYVTVPTTYITEEAYSKSSAKWIPKDALVMALAGQGKTKGMVAQLGIETTCNQSMAAIVLSHKIHPRFILWWLSGNYENIRNLAGGDLRDGLNLELLGGIFCPLMGLAEQTAIADYLDTQTAKIDTLIAKARQAIELMKERRTALISAAVTGKIDVRREA